MFYLFTYKFNEVNKRFVLKQTNTHNHTRQPMLADSPVNKCSILLEQSFAARMPTEDD